MCTEMEMQVMQQQGNNLGSGNGSALTVAYMENKIEQAMPDLEAAGDGKAAVIYMVPENLRASNTEAYKPKLVSIGPYHHGSTDLQPMEASKCGAVMDLCELTGVTIAQLVEKLEQELEKDQVKKPRNYYRNKIDMVGDEALLAHLLIDGCFLFNYLGGLKPFKKPAEGKPEAQAPHDVYSVESGIQHDTAQHVYSFESGIQNDIFLLENQVPFSVLKAIGSAVSANKHNSSALTPVNELACGFVKNGVFQYILTDAEPEKFQHLVDLCHQYLYPTETRRGGQYKISIPSQGVNDQPEVRRLRRAVEYRETGIRFKQRSFDPEEPFSLLDITFSCGVLRIPKLVVDERTEHLLRNIVAYEQESYSSYDSYVTAYVLFMSQLMSKAEDVTLLSEKDILVHQLGSDKECSEMFRQITKGVIFDFNGKKGRSQKQAPDPGHSTGSTGPGSATDGEYHLKDVTVALEKHYRDRRNRWMALLRHTYFSNPWLVLGAVVAMVAFALSISQAALNFLRFARNPK